MGFADAAFVLAPAAGALGIAVGISTALGLAGLAAPGVPIGVVRTVAAGVSAALRRGQDPGQALAALCPRLPCPHAWRASRAATTLAEDPGAGLVETLCRHRLLPRRLAASGLAAERLGLQPLLAWLDRLAVQPSWRRELLPGLAPYVGAAVMLMLTIGFIAVFIQPKLKQIMIDLQIPVVTGGYATWAMDLLGNPGLAWPLGLGALAIIATAIATITAWRWRAARRRMDAEILLAGTSSGASEAELAGAISAGGAAPAGAAGDFAALAGAAGWPGAADPTMLAARVQAADERARRRLGLVRIAVQVLTPLILAIPVWLLASGIFSILIRILNAAEQGT